MTNGVRARARLTLVDDAEPDRAWAALASGSKSLVFLFPAPRDSSDRLVSLGAMVTTLDESPLVWGAVDRDVVLNFWDDVARLHVHSDSEFEIWYADTIGHGVITAVIDDLFGATN